MFVLRCTRKLLERTGPPSPVPPISTTALGDWFAQPLAVHRQRYILLVSGLSRLSVLMPGRDARNLARNFPDALAEVLYELGVTTRAIEYEM